MSDPTITGIIIGLAAGLLLFFLIVYTSLPRLMMKESRSRFDFSRTIEELKKGVEQQGWKLPCEHDLRATMDKFGYQVRDVVVLEICNPAYANEILSKNHERIVSSLMPCRIAVYEKADGSVYLSRMNSGILSKPMGRIIRKTMTRAARDTEQILQRVIMS
ncbi:MAG: DUF302 domain-containing protein [Bacteroidota bacterium]